MTDLQAVLPYWLDRPDDEALAIAAAAREAGLHRLWVGEMATFDAFALATAIGTRTPGLDLVVGPLAAGVRSPVGLALGLSSVAQLTGARVDLGIGASSPDIVAGWHDRPWPAAATRVRETVDAVRPLLAGERGTYAGTQVRTTGFRLRAAVPDARVVVAAFGPLMTRVAAACADEVVLNLVPPAQVAAARRALDEEARRLGRPPVALSVWVAVAVDPGPAALRQLAAQVALYLRPPGYGEMFAALGHADLVARARSGERRATLAQALPLELLQAVCALGPAEQVLARLAEYAAAGADAVCLVPSTAEDAAGRHALRLLAERWSDVSTTAPG